MALEKRLALYGRLPREGLELDEALRQRGFQVYVVDGEDQLLDVARYSQPDALLLLGTVPVPLVARVVSAMRDGGGSLLVSVAPSIPVASAVELLGLGVDYVAGSFQPDWLAAQIQALLRRMGRERSPISSIQLGPLCIDLQQRLVTVEERDVSLTPTEFGVLRVLAERPGTVLASGEIMQQVLGTHISDSEAQDLLKVHIHRLRAKLEPDPDSPRFIRTVRGHGYMYAFERRSRERVADPQSA